MKIVRHALAALVAASFAFVPARAAQYVNRFQVPLPTALGGTGQATPTLGFNALSPMTAAGDLIYGGVSGTGTRLAAGTSTQILIGGSVPSWGALNLATMTSGFLDASHLGGSGGVASSTTFLRGDNQWITPAGGGTITSVSVSGPPIFTYGGSASSGAANLTLTLVSQTANYIWAAPNGSAGNPGFRAMVCADQPIGTPCLLATMTASNSASLSNTSVFTATYSRYRLVFEKVLPATNSTGCQIQVQVSASFQSTGYVNSNMSENLGGVAADNSATTSIPCTRSSNDAVSTGGLGISGEIVIYNPAAGGLVQFIGATTYGCAASGPLCRERIGGYWNTSGVVTGIQIFQSSGNLTSGTVKIYGEN